MLETIFTDYLYIVLLFIFALIFIFLFKGPISGLINRTEKISKDGLSATNAPDPQNEKSESTAEAVQKLLDVVGNSAVINDLEQAIITDLETKGISTDGDSVRVLVKHLAGAQLLLAFEQIHSTIFGTQIALLKRLNERASEGVPSEYVTRHFKDASELFPNAFGSWSVDDYLEFLDTRALITIVQNHYHITELGVEYLTWIARNGRLENRAL